MIPCNAASYFRGAVADSRPHIDGRGLLEQGRIPLTTTLVVRPEAEHDREPRPAFELMGHPQMLCRRVLTGNDRDGNPDALPYRDLRRVGESDRPTRRLYAYLIMKMFFSNVNVSKLSDVFTVRNLLP